MVFARDAVSTLRIFPRIGRMACVFRSLACLLDPPAESPSQINNSAWSLSVVAQSESFPGRFKRCEILVFRWTASFACREAILACADKMMRLARVSPKVWFSLRKCSRLCLITTSTWDAISEFKRPFVWPWNSTSPCRYTLIIATVSYTHLTLPTKA